MTDAEILAYVTTASVLLGLCLGADQAQRVAAHLSRTATLAAQLDAYPLCESDEPAEVYRPLPFGEARSGPSAP